MFSIEDYLSVLGVALPIITIAMIIYMIFFLRKIRDKNNRYFSTVTGLREKLENQIVQANRVLLSDGVRFEDVNHLVFTETSDDLNLLTKVPNRSFFDKLGLDLENVQVEDHAIVCLMPFNRSFYNLYENIKEVCQQLGYTCKRSDEDFHPDDILQYTVSLILKSQLIIAVLDGRNPNVFYEIGIAHSLGKMVLLLSDVENMSSIPFDIQNKRVILYKGNRSLRRELTKCLLQIQYNDRKTETEYSSKNS